MIPSPQISSQSNYSPNPIQIDFPKTVRKFKFMKFAVSPRNAITVFRREMKRKQFPKKEQWRKRENAFDSPYQMSGARKITAWSNQCTRRCSLRSPQLAARKSTPSSPFLLLLLLYWVFFFNFSPLSTSIATPLYKLLYF